MPINMTLPKLGDFYNTMGVYGEILCLLLAPVELLFMTRCKFQLERTGHKKVIAKKHMTNLYEMNSRLGKLIVRQILLTLSGTTSGFEKKT